MNYFLVDYENVNVGGLDGVSNLTESDTVIIFYTENAETLTFGMHRRLNESRANLQFQKVSVKSKNALDFQLCSYLGYLICDTKAEISTHNFFIVSNDNGYSVLPNYWKKFNSNINLKMVINLTKAETKITAPLKSPETVSNNLSESNQPQTETKITAPVKKPEIVDNSSDIRTALSKILKSKHEIDTVLSIIKKSKTKVEINNTLSKTFKSQRDGKFIKRSNHLLQIKNQTDKTKSNFLNLTLLQIDKIKI